MKEIINTDKAPKAIGTYSQAVKVDNLVFISGQIPLNPETNTIESDDFAKQANQVFKNLLAIINASGGKISDVVKINAYLTDLNNFSIFNEVMAKYFDNPYPARAAVGILSLPKNALVEVEATLYIK